MSSQAKRLELVLPERLHEESPTILKYIGYEYGNVTQESRFNFYFHKFLNDLVSQFVDLNPGILPFRNTLVLTRGLPFLALEHASGGFNTHLGLFSGFAETNRIDTIIPVQQRAAQLLTFLSILGRAYNLQKSVNQQSNK